jgi:hypothetical protein
MPSMILGEVCGRADEVRRRLTGGPLGVNPLLTITALTERAIILLAEHHQLRFDAGVRRPIA